MRSAPFDEDILRVYEVEERNAICWMNCEFA